MVKNFTIGQKGKKTVHICTIDNKKNQFIVILTCIAGKIFVKFISKSEIKIRRIVIEL